MPDHTTPEKFSDKLEDLLRADAPPTIGKLSSTFETQSFAIIILLLMLFPALPLPTGGISHVFEIISMLLALEMIAGRTTLWLPKRWQGMKLGMLTKGKALELVLGRIRWFEKHSSPRLKQLFTVPLLNRFLGLSLVVFCLTAFLAPPFSGLDTLPSLGAVVVCLGLILEDALLLLIGWLVGVAGIAVVVGLSSAVITLTERWFHH